MAPIFKTPDDDYEDRIMSDVKANLEEKLAKLEKGLFLMSVDRVRALSNHETVDLIEELRQVVTAAKGEVEKL